eukprot:m.80810 g.80810  ORF g.80810 m.80810 type:complete len:632 (+) comp25349_c0_seq2:193-2088(+)
MTTYSQGSGANPVTQSGNRPWTVEGSIRKVGTMQNLSNLDEGSIASVSSATRKRQSYAKDQQGYSNMQTMSPQTMSPRPRRSSSDNKSRNSTDFRIPASLRRNHGSASSIGCPHLRSENEAVFLEKFEVCEVLGEGSYGVVSKVKHRSGDVFACKAISKTDAGSKALQMLDLEIYVLKLLTHINIVQLIEVYETPQKTCLIMEICEGGNLETLHMRDGVAAYSTKEVSVILQSLASGIAYIHDNEIVHRDLKLENVMVKTKGSFDVKICDFGLCAVKSRNELQLVCGTPIYMAPEVLCDLGKYSPLCDLWSIGVMMFRLLTVEIPFMPRNSSTSAVLEAIHDMSLDQLFARSDIFDDSHIRNCLSGLLQQEPSKRTTAKEFLNDPWISSYSGNGEALSVSFDGNAQQNVFDMMRDFSTSSTKPDTKSEPIKSKSRSKKEAADADGLSVSPSQGGRTMFRKSNPRVLESLQGSHQSQRNSMMKALQEHKTPSPKQALPGYMRGTQSSNKSRSDSFTSGTSTPEVARKANVLQVRLPPLRQDAHEMFAGGNGMRGQRSVNASTPKRHTLTYDFAPADRQGRRSSKEYNSNAGSNATGSPSRRDKRVSKTSLDRKKNRSSSMEDIQSPRARNYY